MVLSGIVNVAADRQEDGGYFSVENGDVDAQDPRVLYDALRSRAWTHGRKQMIHGGA